MTQATLSKSDFLQYLDAPLHLWAAKHDRMKNTTLGDYAQHLIQQGQEVETLAKSYVEQVLRRRYTKVEFYPQRHFEDGPYLARTDFAALDEEAGVYDLYEIKSSTSVKKEHEYDITFQSLVCADSVTLRHHYIVYLNREYVRQGEIDIPSLFVTENVDEIVEKRLPEVRTQRELALQAASQPKPDGLLNCLKPRVCPCPATCHPDLPEFPIYEIPRLYSNKARQLQQQGIVAQDDIPPDFKLSEMQKLVVEASQRRQPLIDHHAIQEELNSLVYPLYFIDYEAYSPAIPLFDGYRPFQQIVFQYSLHVMDSPGGAIQHAECLVFENTDPAAKVVDHMVRHIGNTGSVLVWSKAFEASRNKEMAELLPQHADFLLHLNQRMYDLREFFSKGYYVHPMFHGSSSIKYVLPVLVPELSYEDEHISSGDQAMLAWKQVIAGEVGEAKVEQIRRDLLSYCKLDTLAMVRIWQLLMALA